MIEFAQMRTLDVWYARLDLRETILGSIKDDEARKRLNTEYRRPKQATCSNRISRNW